MRDSTSLILYLPGKDPQIYDLDIFVRGMSGEGDELPTVRLGRGMYHGSGPDARPNNIIIDKGFSFVSRAQCTFKYINGVWYVFDDNSRNGLVLGGRSIRQSELHDGDRLYIGQDEENGMAMMFSSRRKQEQVTIDRYKLKDSGVMTIGRSSSCDIVLRHPMVSRRHCVVTGEGGSYYIEDSHSLHGVILNGNLLTKKEKLRQMDKITIADTTLFFSDGYLYLNEPAGGVGLAIRSLCREVGKRKSRRLILNNVSLTIKPNEFVAIIGGSGAGKTTLLDCLSGITGFTGGEVLVNGESIRTAGKNIRSIIGYVPQKDIVYDNLTLERMLYYSARLRMPEDTAEEEIRKTIDETLSIVELSEHRKTLISKLSGGQKKRASIAVELLASPKLFFLDEPSSGLDPGTEKHLMQILKKLADSGKTVVMVTHTVQNIDLCDRLICMGKGGLLCYCGAPDEALGFFRKKNIIDIYDDLNDHSREVAARWAQCAVLPQEDPVSHPVEKKSGPGMKRLLRQFTVITQRYAEIMKNDMSRLLLLIGMPVILTILVCLAFQADGGLMTKLFGSENGILKAFGSLGLRQTFPFLSAPDTMSLVVSFSCAAFWVGIFNSIQEISKERNIFEREKFTGVEAFPYVMSKFVNLTILSILQALIMTAILFLMCHNLDGMATAGLSFGMGSTGVIFSGNLFFLEIFLTCFLCVLSAMCLGLLISSLVSNDMALVICPICLLPQILFSGVVAKLSGFTALLSKIISCYWSCIAFLTSFDINNMYYGYDYVDDFQNAGWAATQDGAFYDDAAYLSSTPYLFNQNPVVSAWIFLGLICLVCLAAAIITLHFRKRQTR